MACIRQIYLLLLYSMPGHIACCFTFMLGRRMGTMPGEGLAYTLYIYNMRLGGGGFAQNKKGVGGVGGGGSFVKRYCGTKLLGNTRKHTSKHS